MGRHGLCSYRPRLNPASLRRSRTSDAERRRASTNQPVSCSDLVLFRHYRPFLFLPNPLSSLYLLLYYFLTFRIPRSLNLSSIEPLKWIDRFVPYRSTVYAGKKKNQSIRSRIDRGSFHLYSPTRESNGSFSSTFLSFMYLTNVYENKPLSSICFETRWLVQS